MPMAREWFEEWENEPLKRRGDNYDEIKKSIGQRMIDQTCTLFPQIQDYIDYVDVGTPVTNNHYINSTKGEIYGLDHNLTRMSPEMTAMLRPETDISGLYLTGQDVCMCGYTGGLMGGILSASAILRRNITGDLEKMNAKLKDTEPKPEENGHSQAA